MAKIKNVFKINEASMFDAPRKPLPQEVEKKLQAAYQAIDSMAAISDYFSQNSAFSLRRQEAERVMAEIDQVKNKFDEVYSWLQQTLQRTA